MRYTGSIKRRTVRASSNNEATSIVFCYGAKPYTPNSCHYHIRKYGTKPYTTISCNYHTRKSLDAFLSLSNGFKLREKGICIKGKIFEF